MAIILSGVELEVLSGFLGEYLADNKNAVVENVYRKVLAEMEML